MNSTPAVKAPKWFNVVAIVALVWNLFGVMSFIFHSTMSPEALAALPDAERELYAQYPTWTYVAFAIAVFGGTLGSLLLILKKNLAGPILILSLIAILIQMYHSVFIADSMAVYGPGSLVMPVLVIAIAIYLVLLANKAKKSGWTS
jgi:hypothetical protein